MARIRTVKPDFWTDERVGECSVSARLLFIATWNFADDHGGLDRSSKQLKAQAFPYDNIDCEPLVQELLNAGLLIEYESGGKKYLHIKGFRTHQKVEKPARPRVPTFVPEVSTPRVLPESSPRSSGSSLGREWKGREGKGDISPAPEVPQGTVIEMGASLTRTPEQILSEMDGQWREVEGINPTAMERWLGYLESLTPPKRLAAHARLALAKEMAGYGDDEMQLQSVEHCIARQWRNPRKFELQVLNGSRKPYKPAPTTEELEAREAAHARG